MGPASRTLIYHGYSPDPDDSEGWDLLGEMAPTHIAVGINSPIYADRHAQYVRMPWVRRGHLVAERVHELGAVLVLWVWVVADAGFVEDCALDLAELGERWGAGCDLINAELPWVGHPDPTTILERPWRAPHEVRQRADVAGAAWHADHEALADLLIRTRQEHGRGDASLWACVADRLPPATLPMIERASGLVSQMQSVAGKTPAPPHRQLGAWKHIRRRVKEPGELVILGQQAPYAQDWTATPDAMGLRLGCDAHLSQARTLDEAGLAFFDLHQIKQNRWAAPVIRSYSPRVNDPRWPL